MEERDILKLIKTKAYKDYDRELTDEEAKLFYEQGIKYKNSIEDASSNPLTSTVAYWVAKSVDSSLGYLSKEKADTEGINGGIRWIKEKAYSGRIKNFFDSFHNTVDMDYVKNSGEIENANDVSDDISEFIKRPSIRSYSVFTKMLRPKNEGESEEEYEKYLLEQHYKHYKLLYVDQKTGEEREVKMFGHFIALRRILKYAKRARRNPENNPLTEDIIRKMNKTLFYNSPQENDMSIGSFRSQYTVDRVSVTGASWKAVKGSRVKESMEKLLDWYNNDSKNLSPLERAAILHSEFIRIHPFADGNGRTARLLVNYELIKSGYPTITIKANHKNEYFNALDKSISKGDVTDLVNLFKDSVKERIGEYKERYSEYTKMIKENEDVFSR